MAYLIDSYVNTQTQVDGKWVISRPLSGPFITRLKDAWLVIIGKADAVRFVEHPEQLAHRQYDFIVRCRMKQRWVSHFLAMLKYMEFLGNIGSSREVGMYADGDGDFRPKFAWDSPLPSDAKSARDEDGNRLYDAG